MGKIILSSILTILLVATVFAMAKPEIIEAINNKAKNPVTLKIPEHAVELADNVFSLGFAIDPQTGELVEGLAIVKYKENNQKSGNARNKPSAGNSCYTFLASGAKWKSLENYIVDPTNNANLDQQFIRDNMASNINKWENAASFNILGDEIVGVINPQEIGSLNSKNEVIFGNVENSNAIAVTIVWGVFSGPTQNRRLVEWDQIYDDFDFNWSSNGDANAMDFESISTHELGHSVGLGDLYNIECSDETMYGYASEGETKKRTLNAGDIAGISKLY